LPDWRRACEVTSTCCLGQIRAGTAALCPWEGGLERAVRAERCAGPDPSRVQGRSAISLPTSAKSSVAEVSIIRSSVSVRPDAGVLLLRIRPTIEQFSVKAVSERRSWPEQQGVGCMHRHVGHYLPLAHADLPECAFMGRG
jgi:hypothetical protein